MRVVIDTNIIIASLLSKAGRCRSFMNDVYDGKYEVIASETVLSEYERVLNYEKFVFRDSTKKLVMDWFRQNSILVEVNENQSVPEMDDKDPSDKPFYLLARSTRALLVTGNIKHYPVEQWRTMIYELT